MAQPGTQFMFLVALRAQCLSVHVSMVQRVQVVLVTQVLVRSMVVRLTMAHKVYTVGDDDVHEVAVDTGSVTHIDAMALVVANMVRHRNATLAMSVLTIVRLVADTAFALEPLMALVRLKLSGLILRKSLE